MNKFCQDWCLEVNVLKTKVLIFNKSGKLIQNTFSFGNDVLENVRHYRYLGVYFSASGCFNFGQEDIFKRSMKASFKLTKLTTSGEPSVNTSLHLYDHLIKPIVLYGSEIWGVFKTNSAACKKDKMGTFVMDEIYNNNIADKSQVRYLKYILGVNRHSSNLAVISETGRYPMYFSIILSIVKYLYRLENVKDGLLKEAYMLAKELHCKGLQSWYSSAVYILKLLNLNICSCRHFSETQLVNVVKANLIKGFKSFWQSEKIKKLGEGKLDTYFNVKHKFGKETYLGLGKFHLRKAICKLRISAHTLSIETGRYSKGKKLLREERICKFCNMNAMEDEIHFLTKCPLYSRERDDLFNMIFSVNNNFVSLGDSEKANWLLMQENLDILEALGIYINSCFEKRNNNIR